MKAIMYHYVRPHNLAIPHLKHLDIEDFRKQLDFFEKEFGFVSKTDFISALQTGVPAKGVILTFDDGLKCHYEHVFPVLKQRNLWGIFYVPTGMFKTQKIIDVHRIHLLLGVVAAGKVHEQVLELISPYMLSDEGREEFRHKTYALQANDNHTLEVKRILNYFISYEFREQIIDSLMVCNQLESLDDFRSFYINDDEMFEMQSDGMILGSHTENHPVLSKLNNEMQRAEIEDSFAYLKNALGEPQIKTFCYPYGGFHSFTDGTEEILSENNCLFSFNVEHRDIETNDLVNRPQALPRYDCNNFAFGSVRQR